MAEITAGTAAEGRPHKRVTQSIRIQDHTPYSLGRLLEEYILAEDRATDSRYSLEYVSGGDPADYKGRNNTPIRPGYRWVACFPVTGGNEGWYLHVVAIYQRDETRSQLYPYGRPLNENRYVDLAMVKIFGGWEAAAELAGLIGLWLGA